MYSSEHTSGISGPAVLHLATPPSPRTNGNVGQAPAPRVRTPRIDNGQQLDALRKQNVAYAGAIEPSSLSARPTNEESETAIPDVNCNPAAPDSAVHILSTVVGRLCQGHGQFLGLLTCGSEAGFFGRHALGIDLTYQALLFESRTVTGSPHPTVNGTYRTTTHAGTITLRVNF